MFSGPCPGTLCAAAKAVSSSRRPGPLAESASRAEDEATKSHEPAADRPSPDKHGVIRMPSQQCSAFTKKGTQCQRRTLRGQHCRDHMRLLQRLAIAKSTIPGAGEGLFLAKGAEPIRRGERIVLYSGDWARVLPDSDDGGPYFLQITRNLCVDAARTNTALGRWANDPRGGVDAFGKKRRPNALLIAHRAGKQGALKASRKINPGEEILVSYGRSYWKGHGMVPSALVASIASAQRDGSTDLLRELRAAALVDQTYQAVLTSGDLGSLTQRDGLLYDGDRVIVPNDAGIRTRLLTEAHDAGTAGHSGIASTKDRLGTRVHWAGLASDVHDYVASCDSCQRNKVEQRRTAGLLRPPPVPDEPGYAINIDFVFGLPRTERGHTGYLSMTCRLSNWLEPGLCSDGITAEGSAQLVFDRWVRTFGLPAVIVSDRDPRFTGRFWRELWRLLDTKLDMSSAGHPQTDGKAENRQRTANTMLRHYVDFEQTDWDMKLLRAAHAINNTKSVSSGLTPFEVMFRRAPRLPLDVALAEPPQSQAASGLPAVTNFLERHRYIWAAAKQNMLRAQSDQKRHADKHRREEQFAVGDEVLLSTRDLALAADASTQHRAAKLTSRFVGPLKVIRIINPNAYELELPPQLRIHPVQNISKLRRYLRSPDRFAGRPQPLPRPPPEYVDPAGGPVYVVERILAQRGAANRRQYLVKWAGYPTEESSWEPRRNLNCPDRLAEFEAQQLHSDEDTLAVLSLCDADARTQTASPESPGRLTPKGGMM
ncbi:MAG: SET domain-containing protein-lysine N-methyltransferase, partial [Rhodoglobus sp.]